MDRQSPTSIHYSYSNSSNTSSFGISRSLEKSGNFNGYDDSSSHLNLHNSYNIRDNVITEHNSESAKSSTIPEQYMAEGEVNSSQRGTHSVYQSHPNQTYQINGNPTSLSGMDRAAYDYQIQELRMLIQQLENQIEEEKIEKEKVYNKYERCLIQLEDFRVANVKLTEMVSDVNNRESRVETLKISKQNEGDYYEKSRKEDDIKRLKNSLFVAEKEKNSYISINANLEAEKNEIEKQNIEYENQLAMLSQEIERQRFLNERYKNEKASLNTKNASLNEEIMSLKNEIFKLSELRGIESNQNNAKYSEKLEQLFRELEFSNRSKISLESENLRLSNDLRYEKQELSSHIEKMRIEKSIIQRDLQECEERNLKFQKEIKFLQEKNHYSKTEINNILNESNKIQQSLKALQSKYAMLETEHLEYLHSQKFVLEQNEQLKISGRHFEEEIKRSKNQFEKYEQEIGQLRRKIQEISVNSENKSAFLDGNVRSKEMMIHNLEEEVRKKSEYIRELESKNREYEHKIKSDEKERNIGKHELEYKFNELLQTNNSLEMQLKEQFKIIESINMQNQISETRNVSIMAEMENKNKMLLNELQKIQENHANMISHKNLEESKLRSNFSLNLSSFENSIQLIRQEKIEIETKYQETKQENIQIYQQNNNLKNEISRLQKELQNFHQEHTALHQKFTKLNEERAFIENESLFFKEVKLELENKIITLEGIVSKNQSQLLHNQQLYFELENELKTQVSLNKEISLKLSKDASKEKEHFSSQLSRKDAEVFELEQKMGETKSIISKLQMEINEKERNNNELRQEAEGAYQKYNNAERELDYLRENFKNLANEFQMIKQTFASTEKTNSQTNDQMMMNLHEQERALNEKREENKKLSESIIFLKREMNSLAEKYGNLEIENKEYKSVTHILEIKSKEFENKSLQLENRLRESNNNAITIEQKYFQIEKAYQEIKHHHQELQQNNNILLQNNSILEGKCKLTESQNQSNTELLTHKFQNLELQYQQSQHEFEVINSENKMRYQKLEKEYKECMDGFGRLEEKFKQGEIQFRQLEIIHKNLENVYKDVEGRGRDWEVKTREMYEKLADYEAKLTLSTFQINEKEQKIQIYEHKIQEFLFQIQTGEQRYKQVNQNLTEIDQQKNKLSQNTNQLQQKLTILEEDNLRLGKELAVSRAKLLKYEEEIHALQNQNTSMQLQLQQQNTSFFENGTLMEIKTRQMELENKQFLEENKTKNYKIQLLETDNASLKETLNEVYSKHQTLETEYYNTKKSLESLKLKNIEIENKSISLQEKLSNVQQHFTLLSENHKTLEQELIIQREIVHKTERERFYLQETKENEFIYLDTQLKDKENFINRLQLDILAKNNEIQSLNLSIQTKQREKDSLANGSSFKIEELENEHQSIVKHYEHKISQMSVELETIHNMFSHEHNDLTEKLKQREMEYTNLEKDFMKYRQTHEENERQIKHALSSKQYEIQEKEFIINSYMEKINSLTAQISGMGEKLMNSNLRQEKDTEEIVKMKNVRIEELIKELGNREEYYREQIWEIEHKNSKSDTLIEKLKELEITNFQLQTSLSNERFNYQTLMQTLQTILQTNEKYFEVILKHLQQIINVNSELLSSSGANSKREAHNEQLEKLHNKSMSILSLIQQKLDENHEYLVSKQNEEEERRIRQRQEDKYKEEHIIEYLNDEKQKSNSSTTNLETKFEELVYNIKANTLKYSENKNYMDKVITEIRIAIKEEINQAKSPRNQTILQENAQYHQSINNITSKIFTKMESLTSLLQENKEEQREWLNTIKASTERLEKEKSQLLTLIDSYKVKEDEIKTNHMKEIESEATKNKQTTIENQTKSTHAQQEGQLTHLLRQISNLEAKLERKNVEIEEMYSQYNLVLTNFQKETYEFEEQLEQERKEKERIMRSVKEKDEKIERLTENTKNTNANEAYLNNRFSSNDEEIKEMREKYDQKVVHFSSEISRLQKIISNQEQLISSIQKKNLPDSSEIAELEKKLREKSAELTYLKQCYESLKVEKDCDNICNPEIDELRSKLMLVSKENSTLQIQIEKSLKTIHALTTKIETMKKSYNDVVEDIAGIDSRVQGLQGKFNHEIIRKTFHQNNNTEITITKLENQNKELVGKIHEIEAKNLSQKEEYSKLETALEVLKRENFTLRKNNYKYEVEFQKVNFMNQKIGKLNFEVDRISQINIDLNQEVNEARFAIGDEATMERRLFEGSLIIVLLSAEIESLRSRMKDEDKNNRNRSVSREKRVSSASKYSRVHHY